MDCPKCGKEFKNKHGMHTHYSQVHEGSLAKEQVSCNKCGKKFEKRSYRINKQNFCSQKCFNNQDKKIKRECDYEECDNIYQAYKYRLEKGKDKCCSFECRNKNSRDGEYFECKTCGEEFYRRPSSVKRSPCKYCSRECKGIDQSGKNHYAWKDNQDHVTTYYGGWEKRRDKRLEKDNYTCQECGSEKNLHVHHIVPYKNFEDPFKANKQSNLVTLCEKCHLSYEGGGIDLTCI